jgi:phage terminase small subunit
MRENLTPKQRRAIEALLTTGDVTQAAQEARVSRETIYQWMKRPVFRTALRDGTQQALESLSRSLVGLGDKAVKTLADALEDSAAGPSVRVRAADLVLGRLLQIRELVDLEERVCRLEEQNGI